MKNWIKSNFGSTALTIIVLTMLFSDLHNDNIDLEWPHVALVGIVVLIWAHNLVDSFKFSSSGLEAKFKQLEKTLDDIEVATTEVDASALNNSTDGTPLSADETKVLGALISSKYIRRTKTGIKKDAKIASMEKVSKILGELDNVGLVRSSIGKSGTKLWSITHLGRVLASEKNLPLPRS